MNNNVSFHQERTCLNCRYEVVEKLKAASKTCKECFAKDKPDNRYPNWRKYKIIKDKF